MQIGSHNHGDSPEDIAEGIKGICNLIRDKQPQAFLVVLTLLPRGQSPNPLREKNAAVNALVAEQLKGNSRYVKLHCIVEKQSLTFDSCQF